VIGYWDERHGVGKHMCRSTLSIWLSRGPCKLGDRVRICGEKFLHPGIPPPKPARHQNVNESVSFLTGERSCPPEQGLAIADVLTLPLDHIKDMQNTILDPVLIKDTIQDCILWQYRRECR
jgi:hypothetical protein